MSDIAMSAAAAATVNNRFDDLSAEFTNSCGQLTSIVAALDAGAGELSSSMSSGTASFAISWREAFQVCGTTAGVIAGNTNRLSVDLGRLDRDASTTITL